MEVTMVLGPTAMKTYSCLFIAAALFASGCQSTSTSSTSAANGDITVNFQDSAKYTDARDSANGPTSQYYLDELGKYLKEVAGRRLATGQKLTVTFTDIDLAGDIPPGRTDDVRIIKEIYLPHMTLHFQLLDAAGAVVKEGDRRLSDMNYMQSVMPIVGQNEPLRYDKALLSDWVRKEFTP
jgi:Protein of unknown function (DUF3016)